MPGIESRQRKLRPLLWPLGRLYAGAMWFRERLYRVGLLTSWLPGVPVVAVGNIGWGGSGKTPLAGWLLRWAANRGLSPVLLTRGYRSLATRFPLLVTADSLPEESGDEPLLLARHCPEAQIVVDPERRRGGAWAMERGRPDLFVLDDGFQHLGVGRDLDIVLLKRDDLDLDWNQAIPAGPWREGAGALSRAGCFAIKLDPADYSGLRPLLEERLERFRRPVFTFSLRPSGVRHLRSGQNSPDLGGRRYLLVSGVGDHDQVARTAERLLGRPALHRRFPDHHFFTGRDAAEIADQARIHDCDYVVCTGKDAVKLLNLADDLYWELRVEVEFGPALFCEASFPAWWAARWETLVRAAADRARDNAADPGGKGRDVRGNGPGGSSDRAAAANLDDDMSGDALTDGDTGDDETGVPDEISPAASAERAADAGTPGNSGSPGKPTASRLRGTGD